MDRAEPMEPVVTRKKLVRDVKREALERMESAARTVTDFEKVVAQWDHLDENEEHRVNDHEKFRSEPLLTWKTSSDAPVIPPPFAHPFWRALLQGHFLDVIYDCPHELHEQTSSRPVSDVLKTLRENQMEVLYYRAIRQYTFQQIAALRGQSDRNILQVYATLIEGLRKKLHDRLAYRYDEKLPLTVAQKQFMEDYRAGRLKTGKPKFGKGKKKRRP